MGMPTTGVTDDRFTTLALVFGFSIAMILIGGLISRYSRRAREKFRR
jgi:hypothetical protein